MTLQDTREHRNKVIACLATCPLGPDSLLAAFRRTYFPAIDLDGFMALLVAMASDREVVLAPFPGAGGVRSVRLPWQA